MIEMTGRFAGRTAFVTGGSRGIGKAVVERLAEEGAKVAVIDLNEAALAEAAGEWKARGYSVWTRSASVTDREQVESAIRDAADAFGRLDILVNNAGVIRDNLLFRMTDDDWMTVMHVHLNGAFYASRAAQAYMVQNRYGRIINISSVSALGNRGQANYSAAKAGIQGFTKTLAIELGPFGITVNAVAPGFIQTDMTRATAERVGMSFEEFAKLAVGNIPVGRPGLPEDVAHAVAFFADERSSFVNGQILYVAGGPRN
jgi:3-oxoacyl-[acyl-carrier protein] reductase